MDAQHPAHLQLLEQWLKSYRADELFDGNGTLRPDLRNLGLRVVGAWATMCTPMVADFCVTCWLPRLTCGRTNRHFHVCGYQEVGTITTPFDMRVQNGLDRFHLVQDVVDRMLDSGSKGAYLRQSMSDKLIEHKRYICRRSGYAGDPQLEMGSRREQRCALGKPARPGATMASRSTSG